MNLTDKATPINPIVHHLVVQSTQATPAQIQTIANHVATAPFATDLLEVDETLWGSFWQGDVIGRGYQLPAGELGLLRAIRLDKQWPEDTPVAQFLADLHQAVQHPQVGMWTLPVAGEPCVVFASVLGVEDSVEDNQTQDLLTVAWYCATTGKLHAGYRTTAGLLHFQQGMEQRAPGFVHRLKPATIRQPSWLTQTIGPEVNREKQSLTARLDAETLRIRLAGLTGTKG